MNETLDRLLEALKPYGFRTGEHGHEKEGLSSDWWHVILREDSVLVYARDLETEWASYTNPKVIDLNNPKSLDELISIVSVNHKIGDIVRAKLKEFKMEDQIPDGKKLIVSMLLMAQQCEAESLEVVNKIVNKEDTPQK